MQSESIAALAVALSAFQAQCEPATKNAANPHLKNKYADLASIWDAIREPLAVNGLAVVQLPAPGAPGSLCLRTVLLHKSGEWISSEIVMPLAKSDPQGYGSGLTYARRYALAAMLGITQEDDDADRAVRGPAAQPAQQQQRPPQAQPKPSAPVMPDTAQTLTEPQMRKIGAEVTRTGLSKGQFLDWMAFNTDGKTSRKDLTKAEATALIEHLANTADAEGEAA